MKFFKTKYHSRKKDGFTIIETMIAVALFVIVVLTGMDALLNANVVHQKSQDMRTILDSLNFVMEDMSRNMRTGFNFHCIDDNIYAAATLVTPKSCLTGGAVAFEYAYGDDTTSSDQWIYKIESINSGATYNLSKSTDSGTTWVQLNPPEVLIDPLSGFSVIGAEPLQNGDKQQPFIVIKLLGKIVLKNGSISPFSLQTSVSQRLVDIPDLTPASDARYQYVRWQITKRRGADNSIQAAEFKLLENGLDVAWPTGTVSSNPGGNNPGTEGHAKAIDGIYSVATNKWLDFNFGSASSQNGTSTLIINAGTGNKVTFNGYKWATANDWPTRDPISWTVSGSDDGSSWYVIDVRADQSITTTRNAYTVFGF